MTGSERLLELEISVSGSLERPAAEMKVIGEFDRLQVVRFDEAASALPTSLQRLTVDLSATTIIDSAALGSLIRLRHGLDRLGADMSVLVAKPFQVTVMRVSGLEGFLGVRQIT